LINECTEKTRALVKEKRELIQGLSDLLLEKETIDLKQIVSVLGERPFEAKENYKAYLEEVRLAPLLTIFSSNKKKRKNKKLNQPLLKLN
jgi:AFG3 family protein